MIDTLITSRTRIKLFTRLFLNSSINRYLRGLATEFGDSGNAIRLELNRFEKAGLLVSGKNGIKKVFKANIGRPLFSDIHNILFKHLGFDQIIQKVIDGLDDIRRVYVNGGYANGKATGVIDLLFVGNSVDKEYLANLVIKAKKPIMRAIGYVVYNENEEKEYLQPNEGTDYLPLWQSE